MFTGKTKPHRLKYELIEHLHSSGVLAKGHKSDIVINAKENDIAVEENKHKKKEGSISPIDLIIKNC